MGLKKETDKSLSITESLKEKEPKLRKENEIPINTIRKINNNEKKLKKRKNTPNQLVKQGKKYKEELENSDDGVKTGSKLLEKGYKSSKVAIKGAYKLKKKRKNTKIKKEQDKQKNHLKDKLKETHQKKGIKKPQKNKSFIRKAINQPKNLVKEGTKKTALKGVSSYKESLTKDDEGVKVGVEGTKKTGQLIKKSTKQLHHVIRKRNTGKEKSINKLKEHNTKLRNTNKSVRTINSTKNLKTNQKEMLKKRYTRKNIQKSNSTKKLKALSKNITSTLNNTLKIGFNNAKKFVIAQVNKLTGAKILAGVGAIFIKLMPIILVVGIIFGLAMVFIGIGNQSNNSGEANMLSPQVEQWRDLVTEIAIDKDMADYIDLILAIIQVESGGTGTRDIMQSSESAGYPPNYYQTERESVEQGVSYLKSIVNLLKGYNKNYVNDYKLISQSYNFGIGFARYINAKKAKGYDIKLAETYSRDVVAVSLGNKTGATYKYNNPIAISLGKPYLYKNGGNFMYGELVGQYFNNYDGDIAPPVPEPVIVTSHFGPRVSPGGIGSSNHKGIDLACQGGVTPISSLFGGEVIKSAYMGGLGNAVVVKHSNNLYTTYAHMSSLKVKPGQTVKAGETLGICGSTGNSTGPHLHLEVSSKPHANQINPYKYIKQFE